MINTRSTALFCFLLLMFFQLNGQSPHILYNTENTRTLKNLVIENGGSDSIFLSIKHQTQDKAVNYVGKSLSEISNEVNEYRAIKLLQDYDENELKTDQVTTSKKFISDDKTFYTFEDGVKTVTSSIYEEHKPILKHFYKNQSHFLKYDSDNFSIRINPVVDLRYGNDSKSDIKLFQNTRGIKVRGLIDKKVYFYTSVFENQARYNNYVDEYIQKFKTIPSNGSYKSYESAVIDELNGFDYHNAQAYVGAPITKHINIELGHGKHFLGDGYRSLLLSDYAQNYFYLRINTQIWKFHYQNLFTELNPISSRNNSFDELLPKKYMASHFLTYKAHKRFEISLYEAVVFSRENQFEFNYLNPIILYRSVEQFLDSPDNVLIGLNLSWIPIDGYQIYGQLILDEFKFNELKDGNGWWANKYGLQLGAYFVNPFNIRNFDFRIEYNVVRPYTYTHNANVTGFEDFSAASYSHYNQALAHPLGANFSEVLFQLEYQPYKNLQLGSSFFLMKQGEDTDEINWGSNILTPNKTHFMDYGNELLQGEEYTTKFLTFEASYEFFRNYYFDFEVVFRDKNSINDDRDLQTQYIGGGIRINVNKNTFVF